MDGMRLLSSQIVMNSVARLRVEDLLHSQMMSCVRGFLRKCLLALIWLLFLTHHTQVRRASHVLFFLTLKLNPGYLSQVLLGPSVNWKNGKAKMKQVQVRMGSFAPK